MIMKSTFAGLLALTLSCGLAGAQSRWPEAKANAWYSHHVWMVGCNFSPSTAINQLEMWQADSFDPATIDRELGWAEQLGFTSVRVFSAPFALAAGFEGVPGSYDQFLALAHKHHVGVMFVIFDSCWDPDPQLGTQRAPKPFVHNSGWVQSPGRAYMAHPERLDELQPYVQGVVGHFRHDPRIDFWDVYNEPDNRNDPAYLKLEPDNKVESRPVTFAKNVCLGARHETVTATFVGRVAGAVGRSGQALAHGAGATE